MRVRVVRPEHGEGFRLGFVDAPASTGLREVVCRGNLVVSRGIGRRVARGDGFEDFARPADKQTAAFIGRVTPGVGDDRRQRFAIDPDVSQPR